MDLFVVFHYSLPGAYSSLLKLLSWFGMLKIARLIFFNWPNSAVDDSALLLPAVVLTDGRYLLLLLVRAIGVTSVSNTCPKE